MLWVWKIYTFGLVGMSLARSKAIELGFEKMEGPGKVGRKDIPFSSELSDRYAPLVS